jgi:hypothetical protein
MTYTAEEIRRKSDFGLKIDFGDDRKNSARFFVALSKLINFCEFVDQTLASSLDSSLQPIILLEDLEKGSLLIWLKTALQLVDDDALSNLSLRKLFGKYAVKAKYILIDFLEKKTTISNADEIQVLQAELINEYEETFGASLSPLTINQRQITDCIRKYQDALHDLNEDDKVYYLSPSSRPSIQFNRTFDVSPETLEDIITKETISSELNMVLKIKKPDYLGDSKWQFKHGKNTMSVKILDENWLNQFRSRQITIAPGDCLRATVRSEIKYDSNYELISENYEVIQVLEVIQAESHIQQKLDLSLQSNNDELE